MSRFFILVSLLLSTGALSANSILVLGDSLSSAFGFDQNLGWVHQLEEKIEDYPVDDTRWSVVNASIAGETTAGGIARLPALLKLHQPNICVLALGANDGLRGLPLANMHANLSQMVEACQQYGEVVILGMRLPPNYGKAYTQAFAEVYASLSQTYDLNLVPFFIEGVTENPKYMQADNLHPNAAAQPIILDNVWPAIANILR